MVSAATVRCHGGRFGRAMGCPSSGDYRPHLLPFKTLQKTDPPLLLVWRWYRICGKRMLISSCQHPCPDREMGWRDFPRNCSSTATTCQQFTSNAQQQTIGPDDQVFQGRCLETPPGSNHALCHAAGWMPILWSEYHW